MRYNNKEFKTLKEFVEYRVQNISPHCYEDETRRWAIQDWASAMGEFSPEDIEYLKSISENPLDYLNHWEVQIWKLGKNMFGNIVPTDWIYCSSFLYYKDAKEYYDSLQLADNEGKGLVEIDCDGMPLEQYGSGLNEYSY